MRTRIFKAMVLCLAAVLLVAVIAGCGSKTPEQTLPEPDYASAETDTTLQGLSENNLAKYVEYGSPEFKAAVTQEVFDKAVAQISGQLGAYESKQFLYAEKQDDYIIVHYKAKYQKGEIGVRMVFDQEGQVVGQWFE